MTSKEKLQKSINSLTYKESQDGLKKYEKERLECYKDVVKDLKKLEQYEKIFDTPLIEIRKQLEVLDILKKTFKSNSIYMITLKNSLESERINEEGYNKIKQWLEGE